MKPVLEVNGLWKQYRRQARKEAVTSLSEEFARLFQPTKNKEDFWALQDISFSVEAGESLAIIGHNGAGKSTLLKILSRITPPTKGEIILRGRLASLLEVGTGFHAELTGRENIYLNGSILGLHRSDINRKFDEIIAFSGVEDFLDTPLKHYSSGMQLRLAFSVAAHLEPEILVIDEVLAVGDSAFQQKCIDKMTEVSQSGKTLIFVSHNMQAVKKLCDTGLILSNGCELGIGPIDQMVTEYLQRRLTSDNTYDFSQHKERRGEGEIQYSQLRLVGEVVRFGDELVIEVKFQRLFDRVFKDMDIGVAILNQNGDNVIHMTNRFVDRHFDHDNDDTVYRIKCENVLRPGRYRLTVFLRAEDKIQDWVKEFMEFEIQDGNPYGFSNTAGINGLIFPKYDIVSNINSGLQ